MAYKYMTQEQKAKRYDEAIWQLRGMMPNWERLSYNSKTFLQDLIYIFPELSESEDEKIRKCITLCLNECLHSDIIRDYERDKCLAWLEKQQKASKVEEAMRDVEQKAKAFTEAHKGETSDEILAQMRGEQKPAEWSEEDNYVYNEILKRVADGKLYEHDLEYIYTWLKSLKERYTWKSSEEDIEMLNAAISFVEHSSFTTIGKGKNNVIAWLKSLKERIGG